MKRLRSTTRWATVPSQTEAAMNSTSASIAPMPGVRFSGAGAAACARRLNMIPLPAQRVFQRVHVRLDLFLAQVFVLDDEVRQHEANQRAGGPGDNDAPEHPVRKAQNVRDRIGVAPVAVEVAI